MSTRRRRSLPFRTDRLPEHGTCARDDEREAEEMLSTNCSCRGASSREEKRIASDSKILRPADPFDSINRCDLIGRHEF